MSSNVPPPQLSGCDAESCRLTSYVPDRITIISNLALIDNNVLPAVEDVLSNTYAQAPGYNALINTETTKVMGMPSQQWMIATVNMTDTPDNNNEDTTVTTIPQPPSRRAPRGGFLNDFYDDEGWWALAWIAAYDLTLNPSYLSTAQRIFADMHSVFGTTNCSSNTAPAVGGLPWDRKRTYINAITNSLYLSVAAHLAERVTDVPPLYDYLSLAKQQWQWFLASGLLNGENLINDGLNPACGNNAGTIWSYNQGVLLGALTALSRATGDASYLATASRIADAAIGALAPDGVLVEACEPDCGSDGAQFKGVFVRGLAELWRARPEERWRRFLKGNAESVWVNGRDERGELGLRWTGPVGRPADAGTQSSGLDALVAGLGV
ncbi:unnamed protein product [Zymoseptoria tritici ST99CH_1A5]|uniref:Mannan endo-1,6-alpha-mannosidase n=1 Tax=Zymoseptoria tritici ST99CH_1A5 TaxID=1276529 RepID=A0A1Y6LP06_ZYMTR|nr:unnamed protein product [Zymoseptoria tritici ST99CH_1A5]